MNPDILDKILRAIIVFLYVEKLGCTNSSWKRVRYTLDGGKEVGDRQVVLSPACGVLVGSRAHDGGCIRVGPIEPFLENFKDFVRIEDAFNGLSATVDVLHPGPKRDNIESRHCRDLDASTVCRSLSKQIDDGVHSLARHHRKIRGLGVTFQDDGIDFPDREGSRSETRLHRL